MTAAAVKILFTRYLLPLESYHFSEPRINSIWLDKNPDKPDAFLHGVSSMGGQLYIRILGVVVTFLFALVGSLILLKLVDSPLAYGPMMIKRPKVSILFFTMSVDTTRKSRVME